MILNWFKKKKLRLLDGLGKARRTMEATLRIDFDFDAYASRHIFNKVSRKSEYGYYFFPYGYLFRYPRWGMINEMGFRSSSNFPEIREKYSHDYIIGVFGGSNGFGILVPDHQTFTSVLEQLLNQDEELRSVINRNFKVVNLSHPGNVVLNQMINYTLFSPTLRLDLVISHYGVNDSIFGQANDRTLLSRYQISYTDAIEAWGRKLHDCVDVPIAFDYSDSTGSDFRPVQPINSPDEVARMLHMRIKQFERYALSNNSHFIAGLEPWIYSKGSRSDAEEERFKNYNPYYQTLYRNAPLVYAQLEALFVHSPLQNHLNFHRSFQTLSKSETHFGDVCHLLPSGEKIIADGYFQSIRRLLLNKKS